VLAPWPSVRPIGFQNGGAAPDARRGAWAVARRLSEAVDVRAGGMRVKGHQLGSGRQSAGGAVSPPGTRLGLG
jgi:hypothetical protein